MVDKIHRSGRMLTSDEVRVSYVSWVDKQVRFDRMVNGNQYTCWQETLGM